MQSTSLRTAQPPFNTRMVRALITIISAFALIVALVVALALVRPQSVTSAPSPAAAAEQALVDFREGERAMLITRLEAAAAEQALVEFRAGERAPLIRRATSGSHGWHK